MLRTLLVLALHISYSLYIPIKLDEDDEIIFYFGRKGYIVPDNTTDIVLKQSPEPDTIPDLYASPEPIPIRQ